ncbi:hypothetical protein NPIL_493751 [Nephila pilipes]|uniref:Uncharacterized protein n=1 Tax=Nephila pilipes TaxID=299642 RepID=A0A8X6Q5Y8_NEPPI|nr:hypothetical protein NPIL_493751 [Nephila pilipes]
MDERENEMEPSKPISRIRSPGPLIFSADLISNWKLFLQKWTNYVKKKAAGYAFMKGQEKHPDIICKVKNSTDSHKHLSNVAAEALKLVAIEFERVNQINVDEYPIVFDKGLGTLSRETHIETDSTMKSSIMAMQRIPLSLRKGLHDELKRLQKIGVIGSS